MTNATVEDDEYVDGEGDANRGKSELFIRSIQTLVGP